MQDDEERAAKKLQTRKRHFDKLDNQEIDQAYTALLATKVGRRFLWWLLEIGRVNTQPFATDAALTAFNCGEMNVGNKILARLCEVNAEGYIKMMQEHTDERNTRYPSLDGSEPELDFDGNDDDTGSDQPS